MSELHMHVGKDYRVISENFYMSDESDDMVSFFIFSVIMVLICCLIILQSKLGEKARLALAFTCVASLGSHCPLQALSFLVERTHDELLLGAASAHGPTPRPQQALRRAIPHRRPAVCTPVPARLAVDLRGPHGNPRRKDFQASGRKHGPPYRIQSICELPRYDCVGLFCSEFIRAVSLWTQDKGIVKQAHPLNEIDLWLAWCDFGTLESPLQAPLMTPLMLPKGHGGEGSPGTQH